uniref:Uncharacterized protein n=1 Tax=Vespula pensylvanica TaxID=30213 RepID=A0A834UEB3_VESPE|nr:hypothetical protein H0235_002417 [Vespula pensylvanica]
MQPERGHLRSLVVRDAFCRTTAIQCQVSTSGKRRPLILKSTVTEDNIDSEYQLVVTATTTKLIVVSSSLSIVVQGLRINQPVRRRRKLGLAIYDDISRGPIGKFHRCDMTADTLDHSDNMREGQGKGSSLREIGLEDEKFKKTIKP